MYDAANDPYTYENSTVLRNRLDLRTHADLDAFEAEISNARAQEPFPPGDLDFAHYKAIHHHLFQDVYDWAGEVRTVRIAKGGHPFCFPENIDDQAQKLFKTLAGDHYLQRLDTATFARKAARFLSELNAIHAFREGNGRSQLSFFAIVADHAGYPLNFEKLDPEAMLEAMIASFDGDENALADVIAKLSE